MHRSPFRTPKSALRIAVCLCSLCFLLFNSAQAQTNNGTSAAISNAIPATASAGSFFSTVQSYFTSFNPALESTFQKTREIDVFAGADSVSGAGMTASLGISYNLWSFVNLESITRNGSVAGTIVDQQGGIGFQKVVHDVKVVGYLHGGYDFPSGSPYASIGARFLKALTLNTYAGLAIEEHLFQKGGTKTPTISILTGFNF